MELHNMMSANILGYSIVIAAAVGLVFYIVMLIVRVRRNWQRKLLYATFIAVLAGVGVDFLWSRSILLSARHQLVDFHHSLKMDIRLRVYNSACKNIFDGVELYEISISDPELISEITSLIDGSLLQVTSASGAPATCNRFDFDVQNSGMVTGFSVIANNVLEIRLKGEMYRYISANQKLYEDIEAILRRSQLSNEKSDETD